MNLDQYNEEPPIAPEINAQIDATRNQPAPQKAKPAPALIHAGDDTFWQVGGALYTEYMTAKVSRTVDIPVYKPSENMPQGGDFSTETIGQPLEIPVGITIVTSVTGGGKTALLTELAARELHAGREVIFFSGEEMPAMIALYIAAKVEYIKPG
jgi:hypothetical protein